MNREPDSPESRPDEAREPDGKLLTEGGVSPLAEFEHWLDRALAELVERWAPLAAPNARRRSAKAARRG